MKDKEVDVLLALIYLIGLSLLVIPFTFSMIRNIVYREALRYNPFQGIFKKKMWKYLFYTILLLLLIDIILYLLYLSQFLILGLFSQDPPVAILIGTFLSPIILVFLRLYLNARVNYSSIGLCLDYPRATLKKIWTLSKGKAWLVIKIFFISILTTAAVILILIAIYNKLGLPLDLSSALEINRTLKNSIIIFTFNAVIFTFVLSNLSLVFAYKRKENIGFKEEPKPEEFIVMEEKA